MKHTMMLEIENRLEEIDRVNDTLVDLSPEWGVPGDTIATIQMAFDELLTNIISYGYQDQKRHLIELQLELVDNSITVVISDDGEPFNPLDQESPDIRMCQF